MRIVTERKENDQKKLAGGKSKPLVPKTDTISPIAVAVHHHIHAFIVSNFNVAKISFPYLYFPVVLLLLKRRYAYHAHK